MPKECTHSKENSRGYEVPKYTTKANAGWPNAYLADIRKFAMLKPGEKYMLAKRYREHGDPGAAHRLVRSHLRLVVKIAAALRGYGLPMNELIAEGNIGVMKAIMRFDADRGFRFSTERVRQIEIGAFNKLQRRIRDASAAECL